MILAKVPTLPLVGSSKLNVAYFNGSLLVGLKFLAVSGVNAIACQCSVKSMAFFGGVWHKEYKHSLDPERALVVVAAEAMPDDFGNKYEITISGLGIPIVYEAFKKKYPTTQEAEREFQRIVRFLQKGWFKLQPYDSSFVVKLNKPLIRRLLPL